MKLLIAGSRNYPWNGNFLEKMSEFVELHGLPSEVVSGNCHMGPDKFGEAWASTHKIPIKLFPANWSFHGKAAGPIRNQAMADYCDRAIVFWDGQSRGSKNMINALQNHNKPYNVVYPHD